MPDTYQLLLRYMRRSQALQRQVSELRTQLAENGLVPRA